MSYIPITERSDRIVSVTISTCVHSIGLSPLLAQLVRRFDSNDVATEINIGAVVLIVEEARYIVWGRLFFGQPRREDT